MKVAFVARQPGTAHVFRSWAGLIGQKKPGWELQTFCYPEAIGHVQAESVDNEKELQTRLGQVHPDCIVTGTSLMVKEDAECWSWAKSAGIPCLAVAESWVNLPARFILSGALIGPDRIGVPDVRAEAILWQAGFVRERIVVIGNPLLDEARCWPAQSPPRVRLLFVTEPPLPEMGEIKFREKFGQLDSDLFAHLLSALENNLELRSALSVRLHPRDTRETFLMRSRESIARLDMNPEILDTKFHWDLESKQDSLASAVLVVGLGSMLLHEAAASGVAVVALRTSDQEPFPEIVAHECVARVLIAGDLCDRLNNLWKRSLSQGRQPKDGISNELSYLRLIRVLEEIVNG